MVGTSKILTVSYGTFSCTLEGFDDPFSTMRSIAEYFRDLASDDRYFGAEPPTPDAEMLHRIAEREIKRKVIASVDGNAVTLRQMEPDQGPEGDAAEDNPADSATGPAPAKKKRKKDKARAKALAMGDAQESAPAEAASQAPTAAPEASDFAAKMLRIRAAVARSTPVTAYAEDQDQEPLFGFRPISSAFVDIAAPDAELVDETPEVDAASTEAADTPEAAPTHTEVDVSEDRSEAESGREDEPRAAAAVTESAEDDPADDDGDAMALADLINRVRDSAVESAVEEDPEAVAGPEDTESTQIDIVSSSVWTAETADVAEPVPTLVATRLVRARVIKMRKPATDVDDQFDDDADRQSLTKLEAAEPAEEEVASAALSAAISAAVETAEDGADQTGAEDADTALATGDAAFDVSSLFGEEDEGDDEDNEENIFGDSTGSSGSDLTDEAEDDDTDVAGSTLSEEEEADLLAELAAVESDTPDDDADTDTEIGADTLADAAGATRMAMPDVDDDALDAEAEAALIAALSDDLDETGETGAHAEGADAAEAEDVATAADSVGPDADDVDYAAVEPVHFDANDSADDDTDDAVEATVADDGEADDGTDRPAPDDQRALRAARIGKPLHDSGHAGDDASVTRILAETNSQLDDTAASQRRSTIAHLKAAVAATRADRDEGVAPEEEEGAINQYRNDLERVVRPRRPGERASGTTRRLAPLMLVSEQRIDLPRPETALDMAAVRPRRITAGNLALLDDEDFEDDSDTQADVVSAKDLGDAASFEGYAAKLGATDLPDLLEAAAAYAAYVEGRPHFSRPQLMKRAMSAAHGEVSREEGLRSFGTLLRTGRIQKLKRGQFTIAKSSRFRPDSAVY